MTDIRTINLAALSADMEWTVVVHAGNDSITYSRGGIQLRASGGAGLGPFPSPPDDDVLSAADAVVITEPSGESVSMDPAELLAIEPLFRNVRAAIIAARGGTPNRSVRILPTPNGRLPPAAQSLSHSNHAGSYPRPLEGSTLRCVPCVECDLFHVGR